MKAQSSTEFIIILAILLIVFSAVFGYYGFIPESIFNYGNLDNMHVITRNGLELYEFSEDNNYFYFTLHNTRGVSIEILSMSFAGNNMTFVGDTIYLRDDIDDIKLAKLGNYNDLTIEYRDVASGVIMSDTIEIEFYRE